MATDSPDRQRMRDDLRELARTARKDSKTPAPGPVHDFESADSSGYVDLSSFNASDPKWIERELARASAQARPSLPGRAIEVLGPESMTPVSLEALTSTDEGDTIISARRRRRLLAIGAIAGGSVAAIVTLAVIRHAIFPASAGAAVAAAQVTPTPVPQPVGAPPAAPAAEATATAAAAATSAGAAPAAASTDEAASRAASTSTPRKRPAAIAHSHASASASHASVAAAARPAATHAATPAPHAKSGGSDSLLDMIKASVSSGKN